MNETVNGQSNEQKPLRLQVEAYGLLRFISVVEDCTITIGEFKKSLEKEIKGTFLTWRQYAYFHLICIIGMLKFLG